jgi:predicted nuclease of restriction endonuclease-like RecB superfamily
MLTKELLRATVRDGRVTPGFLDPGRPAVQERAEALLAAFRAGAGCRRGDVDEAVEDLIAGAVDHRTVRGLVKLLHDRTPAATVSPVPPAELRAAVFREAIRRAPFGLVEGSARPEDAWAAVAQALGHPVEALQAALYADHPEEQILGMVEVESPRWLIDRYNVALVQGLLLRCAEVEIRLESTPARLRQLLRSVKFHQLLWSARREGDAWCLKLDGPTSIFSQTTRYGLALAKFFPALLLQPGPWALEAPVEWRERRPTLRLTHESGLVSHYRNQGAYETREARWFEERFLALGTDWTLSRSAEPIDQGGEGVVVPDFTFRRDGRVAHLEILGFWRRGSVARRLALLKRHGPKNLVLAVSARLCGDEDGELGDAVVPFKEVVPARQVLERVERVARRPEAGGWGPEEEP